MSLQTESGPDLLTESGLPLLVEGETPSDSGSTSAIPLYGRTGLALELHGSLPALPLPLYLVGRDTLALALSGAVMLGFPLSATLALQMNLEPGTIQPPQKLTLINNDGVLTAWFYGYPISARFAVQVDDGPLITPDMQWRNPGVTGPAIVTLGSPDLPMDGLIHRITVSVWYEFGDRISEKATAILYSRATTPPITKMPDWCGATLIRQGTEALGDLIEVKWRHSGAVRVVAKYRKRNAFKNLVWTEETLGYADAGEDSLRVDDMGSHVWDGTPGKRWEILFGVSAMQYGTFGPTCWATSSVSVFERSDDYSSTGDGTVNPDALTAQFVGDPLLRSTILTGLSKAFPTIDYGTLSVLFTAIFNATIIKVKDVVAKGGHVTFDDLGRFEARWNEKLTRRSVAFVPSIGFQEGTKRGYPMTDAEAKA